MKKYIIINFFFNVYILIFKSLNFEVVDNIFVLYYDKLYKIVLILLYIFVNEFLYNEYLKCNNMIIKYYKEYIFID